MSEFKAKKNKIFSRTLVWVLIGMGLGSGFVFPVVWPVSILAVTIFLIKIIFISSLKEAVWAGFLVGLFSNLLVFSWVWSIYPIDWVEVPATLQLTLILLYWLLTAWSIAISVSLFTILVWWLNRKKEWLGIAVAPIIWLGSEVIGSFLFSLVMYAPEGGIQTKLSFGYVGYLLAEHDWLVVFAKWGGVYMLSFLFVVVSSLLALAFLYIKSRYLIVLIGCFLGIGVFTSYTYSLSIPETTINQTFLIVETDFSQISNGQLSRDEIQFALYKKVFRTVPLDDIDVIAFPEGSNIFSYYPSPLLAQAQVGNFLPENSNLKLIDSSVIETENGKIVRSYQFDGATNKLSFQDKSYLVPQGEFWSYWFSGLVRLAFGKEQSDELKVPYSYIASDRSRSAADMYPILGCFSSTDPLAVRNIRTDDPAVPIIHTISLGWFHDSTTLERQQNNMLKVQAVWNNRVIISSTNEATSKVYFPNGAVSPVQTLADKVYTHIPALTVMRLPL